MTKENNLGVEKREKLMSRIEEVWGDRFDFQKIEAARMADFNLKRVDHDGQEDCIDERDDQTGNPRLAQKLAGASMAGLVLRAIDQQESLGEVMVQSLKDGEVFYWHDDDHDHKEGMTGCGANDHEAEIVLHFLTKVRRMDEKEAVSLRDKVIGGQTAADRVQLMKETAQSMNQEEMVVKVSSLVGPHSADTLAINMIEGTTLIHGQEDKRNFVVDSGNIDQIHLALATVDILSDSSKPLAALWVD